MKILFLVLSLIVGDAFACSCSEWGSPREMLTTSQAAFIGTPQRARLGEINPDSGEPFVVTDFRINRSFKPRSATRMTTHSEVGNGSNCGTKFRAGVSYLIFAYKYEGKLYTDNCSFKEMSSTREMTRFVLGLERLSRE